MTHTPAAAPTECDSRWPLCYADVCNLSVLAVMGNLNQDLHNDCIEARTRQQANVLTLRNALRYLP